MPFDRFDNDAVALDAIAKTKRRESRNRAECVVSELSISARNQLRVILMSGPLTKELFLALGLLITIVPIDEPARRTALAKAGKTSELFKGGK